MTASVRPCAEVFASHIPPQLPVRKRAAAWPPQSIPAPSTLDDVADRLEGKFDQVCGKLDILSDGIGAMVATIGDLVKAMRAPLGPVTPAFAMQGGEPTTSAGNSAGVAVGTAAGDIGTASTLVMDGCLTQGPLQSSADEPEAEHAGCGDIIGHPPSVLDFVKVKHAALPCYLAQIPDDCFDSLADRLGQRVDNKIDAGLEHLIGNQLTDIKAYLDEKFHPPLSPDGGAALFRERSSHVSMQTPLRPSTTRLPLCNQTEGLAKIPLTS